MGSTFSPSTHPASFVFKIHPEPKLLSALCCCSQHSQSSPWVPLAAYYLGLLPLPLPLFTLFLAGQPGQHSWNVTQITSLLHRLPSSLWVKVGSLQWSTGASISGSPLPLIFVTSQPSGLYSDAIHVASGFSFLHSTLMIYILFLCAKRHIWCLATNYTFVCQHIWCLATNYKILTFPPG